MRPAPIFITEITDQQGQVLEHNEPALAPAIPPTDGIPDHQHPAGRRQARHRHARRRASAQPTAGKTGTTNDLDDAWFVGYTPQLLAAVWIGFDNKRPIGTKETGGKVAAPIWKAFMEQALDGVPRRRVPDPGRPEVRQRRPATGGRAGPGGASRLECFRPGTEPQPGAVPAVQLVNHHQPTTRAVVARLHAQRILSAAKIHRAQTRIRRSLIATIRDSASQRSARLEGSSIWGPGVSRSARNRAAPAAHRVEDRAGTELGGRGGSGGGGSPRSDVEHGAWPNRAWPCRS